MLSGVKKAAAALQKTSAPTDDLNKALQQEKYCADLLQRLLEARKQVGQHWSNWAEKETSTTIRLLVGKLSLVDTMWLEACSDYLNQHEAVRDNLKHIVNGEKTVAERREKATIAVTKTSKLRKQATDLNSRYSNKPSDAKKLEQLTLDLGKATSIEEIEVKEFKQKEIEHQQFKHAKLRDSLKLLFAEQVSLAERCLQLSKGCSSMVGEFTSVSYSRITPTSVQQADAASQNIIHQLSMNTAKRSSKLDKMLGQVKGAPETQERRVIGDLDVSRGHEFGDLPVYLGVPDVGQPEFGRCPPNNLVQQSTTATPRRPLPPKPTFQKNPEATEQAFDDQPVYRGIPDESPLEPSQQPPEYLEIHADRDIRKSFDHGRPLPPEPDGLYHEVGRKPRKEPPARTSGGHFEDDSEDTYENVHEPTTYDNLEATPPPLPNKQTKAKRHSNTEQAEKNLSKEEPRKELQMQRSSDSVSKQSPGVEEDEDEYEIVDGWKEQMIQPEAEGEYDKAWA